jgi:hypothetical protein
MKVVTMAWTSHRLRSSATLTAAIASVFSVAGCSDLRGRGASTQKAGALGIELQAGSLKLDSVAYDISGNGFRQAGTLDVSNSTRVTAVIGGIPEGSGYTIRLSAAASNDPTAICTGSATFDVVSDAVTDAPVHLQCRLAPSTGSVLVDGSVNVCPRIDTISVAPAETTVGRAVSLTGAASDSDAAPGPLTYVWASSGGALAQVGTPNASFTCTAPGAFTVTLTAGDGDCTASAAAVVTCSAAPALVKINEIESNGGDPGDWVELYNPGTAEVDVSGWGFRDNDDTHALYLIPAGTSIAPGAYLVLEEAAFGFGLGAADSARLYDATAMSIVDSYSWTTHAATTYGRCPNGTGGLTTTASVTKGLPNDCAGDAGTSADGGGDEGAIDAGSDGGAGLPGEDAGSSLTFEPWPGPDAVIAVDGANVFGTNMSGLSYQPATAGAPAVLWAVQNGPSKLYRLSWDGSFWSSTTTDDWTTGKNLHYTDGTGNPDSEGVTKAAWDAPEIYVSTERSNDANTVSRLCVLRFDTSLSGVDLTATHEWDLTADLPAAGPNLGLEAITWVPDAYLVAKGLLDESTGQPYDPNNYPNHAGGLFLVGIEQNGIIYAYAFDHASGGFHRVATVASGQISIMDLAFDRDVGGLFAYCDNTCGNKATLLDVDTDPASPTRGKFKIARAFNRPSGLADANNEGIAIAPESECQGGIKSFFWTDDSQTDGHALRQGSIRCGRLF